MGTMKDQGPNPSGICMCGCGGVTSIAKRTTEYSVKGEPQRFINGHRLFKPTWNIEEGANSSGFCQCGCGELAPIATRNDTNDHKIKGKPLNFISGHNLKLQKGGKLSSKWKGGRISQNGYVGIYMPEHPRAHHGHVCEHVLIAEKALGKPLPPCAIVHHHNGKKDDNKTPGNLVICQDIAYHLLLHQRMRAYKVSGHANWRKCQFCKKYDDPENMRIYNAPSHKIPIAHHKACLNSYRKKRKEDCKNESLQKAQG